MSIMGQIVEEVLDKSDEEIKKLFEKGDMYIEKGIVYYKYVDFWNMRLDEPEFYERCKILQRENNIDNLCQ